jgi:hypothetical protein
MDLLKKEFFAFQKNFALRNDLRIEKNSVPNSNEGSANRQFWGIYIFRWELTEEFFLRFWSLIFLLKKQVTGERQNRGTECGGGC